MWIILTLLVINPLFNLISIIYKAYTLMINIEFIRSFVTFYLTKLLQSSNIMLQ